MLHFIDRQFLGLVPKQAKFATAKADLPEATACSPSAILQVAMATSVVAPVRAGRIFRHLGFLAMQTSLVLGLEICESQDQCH